MSFRPRKFAPLPAGHSAIGQDCPICEAPLRAGDVVALMPIRIVEPHLAEATPMHWRCLPDDLRDERCVCDTPDRCPAHGG